MIKSKHSFESRANQSDNQEIALKIAAVSLDNLKL